MSITQGGKVTNSYSYGMDGQIASANERGKQESFLWDGLALLKRGTTSYVNEPAVTGGNPILANGKAIFDDMLGNSLGVVEKDKFTAIKRNAFGQTHANPAGTEYNLFTGKPRIEGLGYAFLFRNYRSELGKWQTADPLGYPDGFNNLAYVNNHVTSSIDWLGGLEVAGTAYIDTKVLSTGTRYVTNWIAVGDPFYTAGGTLVQQYKRAVEAYQIIGEYTVTPYYDSTWKTVDDIGDIVVTATGATLGIAVGALVGGEAGAYVGVVAGGIITYYICDYISPNPTRLVWEYIEGSSYEEVTDTYWAIKYEVVE